MITWIQSHPVEIFAVIGALYGAARVLVALTPTPKDDAALAKVWIGLRVLAKAFGLDLKQGVSDGIPKKPTSSGKMGLVVLFSCTAFLTSCRMESQQNPSAELLIAQKTFTSIVEILTTLQRAGKFKPEETEQLTILIHEGHRYLSTWVIALENGEDTPNAMNLMNRIILKLLRFQLEKGGI